MLSIITIAWIFSSILSSFCVQFDNQIQEEPQVECGYDTITINICLNILTQVFVE
uniref:Uncharacterized protein n=1 Tax=Parascaris equorum TaxID=6256 RepID=A0A914RYY3_PAREQ